MRALALTTFSMCHRLSFTLPFLRNLVLSYRGVFSISVLSTLYGCSDVLLCRPCLSSPFFSFSSFSLFLFPSLLFFYFLVAQYCLVYCLLSLLPFLSLFSLFLLSSPLFFFFFSSPLVFLLFFSLCWWPEACQWLEFHILFLRHHSGTSFVRLRLIARTAPVARYVELHEPKSVSLFPSLLRAVFTPFLRSFARSLFLQLFYVFLGLPFLSLSLTTWYLTRTVVISAATESIASLQEKHRFCLCLFLSLSPAPHVSYPFVVLHVHTTRYRLVSVLLSLKLSPHRLSLSLTVSSIVRVMPPCQPLTHCNVQRPRRSWIGSCASKRLLCARCDGLDAWVVGMLWCFFWCLVTNQHENTYFSTFCHSWRSLSARYVHPHLLTVFH